MLLLTTSLLRLSFLNLLHNSRLVGLLRNHAVSFFKGLDENINSAVEFIKIMLHILLLTSLAFWFFIRVKLIRSSSSQLCLLISMVCLSKLLDSYPSLFALSWSYFLELVFFCCTNLFLLSKARLLMFSAVYGKRSQSLLSMFFSTHMKMMSGKFSSLVLIELSFSLGMLLSVLKTMFDLRLNKIW